MLGIYAPYTCSETTALAIRLAALARRLNLPVSWLADQINPRVHSGWDGVARSLHNPAQRQAWIQNTRLRLWFVYAPTALTMAFFGNRKACNWLVLSPAVHGMVPVPVLQAYCRVLGPEALPRTWHQNWSQLLPETFRVMPWTAGLESQERSGLLRPPTVRGLFWLDGPTSRALGRKPIAAAKRILHDQLAAQLLVATGDLPSRTLRACWQALAATYPGRVQVRHLLRLDEQAAALAECDCLVDLSLSNTTGLWAARAQALGVPAISWDLPAALYWGSQRLAVTAQQPGRTRQPLWNEAALAGLPRFFAPRTQQALREQRQKQASAYEKLDAAFEEGWERIWAEHGCGEGLAAV